MINSLSVSLSPSFIIYITEPYHKTSFRDKSLIWDCHWILGMLTHLHYLHTLDKLSFTKIKYIVLVSEFCLSIWLSVCLFLHINLITHRYLFCSFKHPAFPNPKFQFLKTLLNVSQFEKKHFISTLKICTYFTSKRQQQNKM